MQTDRLGHRLRGVRRRKRARNGFSCQVMVQKIKLVQRARRRRRRG